MNREFEILNEKLNVLFEELMWLRRDFQRNKYERECKELEYKIKNDQDDLERYKDNARFEFEHFDERQRSFRGITKMYPVEEVKESDD